MAIATYLLFVFRSSPYGSSRAREGIDALLATSVFELPLKVVFTGDGVFQLRGNQAPCATKNIEKSLKALPMYDIEEVYIHRDALTARHMEASSSSIGGHLIDSSEVTILMRDATHILSF